MVKIKNDLAGMDSEIVIVNQKEILSKKQEKNISKGGLLATQLNKGKKRSIFGRRRITSRVKRTPKVISRQIVGNPGLDDVSLKSLEQFKMSTYEKETLKEVKRVNKAHKKILRTAEDNVLDDDDRAYISEFIHEAVDDVMEDRGCGQLDRDEQDLITHHINEIKKFIMDNEYIQFNKKLAEISLGVINIRLEKTENIFDMNESYECLVADMKNPIQKRKIKRRIDEMIKSVGLDEFDDISKECIVIFNKFNKIYGDIFTEFCDEYVELLSESIEDNADYDKLKIENIGQESLNEFMPADISKMAVYIFSCNEKNCDYKKTATLFGAPSKCDICGSKDLSMTMTMTSRGTRIINPVTRKLNQSLVNQKTDVDIKENAKEMLDGLDKKIRFIKREEKSIKLNESGGNMEKWEVKCTNNKCGFKYETNEVTEGSHRHNECQVCGFRNCITQL